MQYFDVCIQQQFFIKKLNFLSFFYIRRVFNTSFFWSWWSFRLCKDGLFLSNGGCLTACTIHDGTCFLLSPAKLETETHLICTPANKKAPLKRDYLIRNIFSCHQNSSFPFYSSQKWKSRIYELMQDAFKLLTHVGFLATNPNSTTPYSSLGNCNLFIGYVFS